MTTFAPGTGSSVPSNINTLEKLFAWAAMAAEFLNRNVTYKELNGDGISSGLQPLVDISYVTAADGTKRAIVRASIEIDPNFDTSTAKLWESAKAWTSAALPSTYTTN